MQINLVSSIFCIKNLNKSSNHEGLINKYQECVEPILITNRNAQQSELKRIAKIYSRPLIQLSNNLQNEIKAEIKQISQQTLNKIRHTLLQIAFLTDQCLVKLQSILKMKPWSIEKMWNGFLCRAVSYRFWTLVPAQCDVFLHYLHSLDAESFSNQQMSEFIFLVTSSMYNKSRALIETNLNQYYKECIKYLLQSIKLSSKHVDIQWRITYLDRVFRVINKVCTDYAHANDNINEEFALRSQALYCLLIKYRLTQEKYNKENVYIITKQKTKSDIISFWDITHQYIRYVKLKYTDTNLIKFRKMIIEMWIQYDASPNGNEYHVDFLNLCVDYITSIGECGAKIKIEVLSKIMQQMYTYIDDLNAKMEFKIIYNIVNSVSISQIALKYDIEYIQHSLNSWNNTCCLLRKHHTLFTPSNNDDVWKLLSKSIRNIPYLARYIEDSYSFGSGHAHIDDNIIKLLKSIASNVKELFNIWSHCNQDVISISVEKLKNVNHRLFDTLITMLSIQQKVFLHYNNNNTLLNIGDIVHLLKSTAHYLYNHVSDTQLFRSFVTKGYNTAVQIYNTCNHYEEVIDIAEIVHASCCHINDTDLSAKCDKIYESALFKCDNAQIVYYKIARNIAHNLQSEDISSSYKYLKLLVKYQTHSKNRYKLKNTPSMSLIDILQNIGIDMSQLNENIVVKLLTEQLRLYQSSFSYNTTNQQIEILETLLKDYFCGQRPIQRAIALIDFAKLIRVSKLSQAETATTPKKQRNKDAFDELFDADDMDDYSLDMEQQNPLDLLEEAIDLLIQIKKTGVDDDEVQFEAIIDDVLASGYLWRGIVKRELFATEQAVKSQIDSLSTSLIHLGLEANDNNDETGFESILRAMDIWSNLITKQCKTKCKHISSGDIDNGNRACAQCHSSFRDLFATIQHLQIMVDYMHLNNLIPKEIFLLDRMIRLLSTMSDSLSWCREYRLLCLCWSGCAYYRFGNLSESEKIFGELEPVLLKTTPDISIHLHKHIQIIYAQYQAITHQKEGIKTLLRLRKEFERNKANQKGLFKWEDIYLLAKLKYVLAQVQIESPQLFACNEHIDAQDLAKDAMIHLTTLIKRINERFMFKDDIDQHCEHITHSSSTSTYSGFIDSLSHKKYQFIEASSAQYRSVHHPQSVIHQSHTKMLYHYPSEFRLIAEFLSCIYILGRCMSIVHAPRMSLYHFENGKKAAHNLVLNQQEKVFVMNLAKIESKQRNWTKYEEHLKSFHEISILSCIIKTPSYIYRSLSKITPYAHEYDSKMMRILSLECTADGLRYKAQYKEAMDEYQECVSIITSFVDENKSNFAPLLALQCALKRKYAVCLLYLRETSGLNECLVICFDILSQKAILSDLLIAKTKLCIGQCLILQIQNKSIMQTIWKGNAETMDLHEIIEANMMNKEIVSMNDMESCNLSMDIGYLDRYDPNSIAAVLCCRQHLIQCLLILLHLNTVNPELIKKVSFALSYIYGECNMKWSAMFLNMTQSVATRQNAIKQYSTQLNTIKQQWHEFKQHTNNKKDNADADADVTIRDLEISMEKIKLNKKRKDYTWNEDNYLTNDEYNTLYGIFYHKVCAMRYYNDDGDHNGIDYNDYNWCYDILGRICNTFYSQTVQYLQHSWNCLSMEVDDLLQTMLVSVINPSSTSRNVAMDIVVVDIAINRQCMVMNETKDEEDDHEEDDLFLYFDECNHKYDAIMHEFNTFLHEANESTHSGKECKSRNEVKAWWDNRYKLDEKLKHHLYQLEVEILGIFRCLFVPHFRNKQSKKLLHSSCDALVIAINEYLLKKTSNQYRATCTYRKGESRSSKMILFQKLLELMMICHAADEQDVNDDEVKHGLSYVFGVSDNYLLNKLLDTVKQHIITIHKKFMTKVNIAEFDPLIMSIGDTLSHLPWENIPILKYCVASVCRVPCFEFASLRVLQHSKYKSKSRKRCRYYYIVNPKGDLKKTEARFNRLLNDDWRGIKGEIPSFDAFRDGLERNDVFLYVGHNGGEEFVNCSKLQTFDINAIVFLMGCSSGLLKKKGMYQSNGVANYYMIASCPIVVANLWDVTDKDIDQFSAQMLRQSILKKQSIIDIAKAINTSRDVCKLKYLNGAAPICYGIPFHLINGIYV